MLSNVEETLACLYPSKRWGEMDDSARINTLCEHDADALSEDLANELEASTFFVAGDYCNFIYILCVGREPSLVQIRDGEIPIPYEIESGAVYTEQYLRVCLSHVAPYAGVQQVELRFEAGGVPVNTGQCAGNASRVSEGWITESPRSGVFDAPFLRRFQRLVSILPAYDLIHLDFGEISAPPLGYAPGRYSELYGDQPHVCNYFFFPEPSNMRTTSFVGD